MPPPSLLDIPHEILSQIGFQVALSTSPAPGPPSQLVSLLLTHRSIAADLSLQANPSLYADILRATWDTDAVDRRYGRALLADANIAAADLVARWQSLHRIRAYPARRERERGSPRSENSWDQEAGALLMEAAVLLSESGACPSSPGLDLMHSSARAGRRSEPGLGQS